MKFNRFAAVLAVISVGLHSCSNDIDLVAPYKETGIIYGLINPADTVHYVRIQKAFLGEGNALIMAQVPDSIYFGDILDVKLHRIKNGTDLDSFPLTRFVGPDKDPGTFPVYPNILYKTNGETIFRDSEYKITVRNTQTGNAFYAQTPIVDSIKVLRPTVNETIKWANQYPVVVEYVPTKNGKVYNLTIRFHFNEEHVSSGTIEARSIDWIFPNTIINNPESLSSIYKEIKGEDFYKFVDQKLVADPDIRRYAGGLDFIFTAGAEFLANYLAINQATTSILTSIPNYSNVEGGIGIFSSRFIQNFKNRQMDPAALDMLKTGPYTSDLGFQ